MRDDEGADRESDKGSQGPVARVCSSCEKSFQSDEWEETDAERTVCPECRDRRTAIWVIGLFLLFFCFVVLPLMIQLFGTPRPPR